MSKYRITLEGKTYEMEVEPVSEKEAVQPAAKGSYKEYRNEARDSVVRIMDPSAEKAAQSHQGEVASPMPGTVIAVHKNEGAEVKAGEVVLVLEAMKMENEITAPADGKITAMYCRLNQTVSGGEILFEVH